MPFDRRVWQECTTLRDAGWTVHVICPQGTKRDMELEAEVDGVRIHRYPLRAATGGPAGYLREYGSALWHTMRLARKVGPVDVVHACNPPDLLFLPALWLKRRGARFVFDQHDLVPELYLSRFDRGKDLLYRGVCALERRTYRAADVVIATNESYRDVALSRGGKRPEDVFVVRSAPQVERFQPVPPETELKRGKPHLLCYLGVMGPQDGVDYALRALAKLRDELGRTDWHAVFVGSGDAFDAMVELSRKLGLSDQVQFTGRIPDADLVRYLSTADVCLSPDPRNPLNDVSTMNKVLEYMAMGRPSSRSTSARRGSPPVTPPSTRPPTTRPSSPGSSRCCSTIRRSGPAWARSARNGSAESSRGGTRRRRCSTPTPPPAVTAPRWRRATRSGQEEAAPMSEDPIRLVTIGRIFRRRWRLLAALAVVGALVGYGVSVLFPPRYTTSTSVVLPGQWEQRELLTQSEIATSSAVVDRAAAKLDWPGVSGSDLREQVGAKAADGNIIKVSGTAETPERAQRLADQVAKEFVSFAARIAGDPGAATGPEALRKKVEQTSRRITELAKAADPGQSVESVQGRTELEKLRTALEEAMDKLGETDPAANKSSMVIMGPSPRPAGEAPPTRMQLMAGGALLFFLLAVIGHLTAARASRRLRTEAEIAAALGSAFLGTVDVPEERSAARSEGGGLWARIRRLLGLDIRWDTPAPRTSGDEAGRKIRYRRVCARLRGQLPSRRRLLVVVPDGDEIARRAAGQLAAEAESDPSAGASSRETSCCGWSESRWTARWCRTAPPNPAP